MIRLLFYFWPILVPLLICLLYVWQKRRRACRQGECVPSFREGPWFRAVLASLLIGIAILLTLPMLQEHNAEDYRSPLLRHLDKQP